MRILIVGSAKKWAIESFYFNQLKNFAEVDVFNARDLFLEYYTKSATNKIIYRLGISPILNRINKELLNYVRKVNPTIVWVFKGMEIYPKTLEEIKLMGVKLANYNADDPFDYTFSGSGNSNVKNSLSLYNHHFSYSKRIITKFSKELNIKCTWLPFAYNIANPLPGRVEYSNILCFIGNPDEKRAEVLKYLGEEGIRIHVYGNNWSRFLAPQKNVKISQAVLNEELISTSQKYYCQLNIFRPQNINSHNMRTFEMPALGCIMFAPESEEHLEFFDEGKDAFFYKTKEELLLKVHAFMNLNEATKRLLSENAYERIVNEKNSYSDRALTVYNVFKRLIK